MNFFDKCPNCGEENVDLVYRECCAKTMCECCADDHDEKYREPNELVEKTDN
jgi:hypothetical protein